MEIIPTILRISCPNIITIIGDKTKFWSKVEIAYSKRIDYIKKAIQDENYISLRKSFIDHLFLFKEDRDKSIAFLKDIDLKAKSIYDHLSNSKSNIDKLRSILEQLVLPETEDSKSNDRIAEIYAIDYLLSRKNIRIIELEYGLSNGKHIDCLIQNTDNNETVLVDFFSIIIDSSKVENSEKLGNFLISRIIKKYKTKTSNLKTLDCRFRVFPILWVDNIVLKENLDFLVDSESIINTEFCMLKGIENITEKKYHYVFGTIDELKYWG